jgi:hypothetical protein
MFASASTSPQRIRKRDVFFRLMGFEGCPDSSPRSVTSSVTSSTQSQMPLPRESERALHSLFHSWDVDGDFELRTDAIRSKLARNSHALTGAVLRVLDLADADYGGRLTEEEFVEDMLAELSMLCSDTDSSNSFDSCRVTL